MVPTPVIRETALPKPATVVGPLAVLAGDLVQKGPAPFLVRTVEVQTASGLEHPARDVDDFVNFLHGFLG
jgi:hypothetical protein